ncbi:MAG: hypothetical protein ACOZCO_07150 [Bacteroidota bacterium]
MEKIFNEEWFYEGFNKYNPNPVVCSQLKIFMQNVKLIMYVDVHCKDTKPLIPPLFKVLKSISHHKYKIIYVTRWDLPFISTDNKVINRVPTIILQNNSRQEIGRITETLSIMPLVEKELLYLLKPKK